MCVLVVLVKRLQDVGGLHLAQEFCGRPVSKRLDVGDGQDDFGMRLSSKEDCLGMQSEWSSHMCNVGIFSRNCRFHRFVIRKVVNSEFRVSDKRGWVGPTDIPIWGGGTILKVYSNLIIVFLTKKRSEVFEDLQFELGRRRLRSTVLVRTSIYIYCGWIKMIFITITNTVPRVLPFKITYPKQLYFEWFWDAIRLIANHSKTS